MFEKIKVLLAVEYIYVADEPVLKSRQAVAVEPSKETVAALPEALVAQLHDAALSADQDRMMEIVDQIEKQDAAVAGSLRRLAENFEYQKLLEITVGSEKKG